MCLEGRGEGKSVPWLVHMLMPLHWSSEVAETFPGLPSTPALKFSRGELNWQNSIPLRTSGTPAGLLHPALLGFFSLPAVWATGRQPRLASYLQHSSAQPSTWTCVLSSYCCWQERRGQSGWGPTELLLQARQQLSLNISSPLSVSPSVPDSIYTVALKSQILSSHSRGKVM